MSKANPETIISDRLLAMEESTIGLNRSKNNLYNHMCELLAHLPLSSDAKNRKVDSVKELAAISEYIKNCASREKQAEPLPEEQVHSLFIQLNQQLTRKTQIP
jgi:hypothetical protein